MITISLVNLALVLFAFTESMSALNVTSISDCPALSRRPSPPADITDLRIDDIKIFASLGDSIMAGYALHDVDSGIFGLFNANTLQEYPGQSYLMGADPGAISIANFIKRYNPKLYGPSVGTNFLGYLRGDYDLPYNIYSNYLNAARVGAMALNLHYELDYIIDHISDPNIVAIAPDTAWKMITINIGSNDICRACSDEFATATTADAYAAYIEETIKKIKSYIPNVLVNLMGMFKISDVYSVYEKNPKFCNNRLILNPCSCFNNLPKMDNLVVEYNKRLEEIATKYAAKPGGNFGVIYTPLPIDINSLPVEAYSNIDCFHPSLVGHHWFAKAVWNQLFLKIDTKPSVMTFDADTEIYCPVDGDRIPVS